jgi:tetratricopeptide (TPR) repeat protein
VAGEMTLEAIQRARPLLDEGWRANDLGKLQAALLEAKHAVEMAQSGAATPAVQDEARAVQQEVQTKLDRAENNRLLLQGLLDIAVPHETPRYESDASGLAVAVAEPSVEDQYVAAFHRRWPDLDIDQSEEAEVVSLLAAEPQPVVEEMVAGLDAWMLERRQKKQAEAKWRRLVVVADRLDHNSQRRQLRALLVGQWSPPVGIVAGLSGVSLPWSALWELAHGERWQRLAQVRNQMSTSGQQVLSLVLLARVCAEAGDTAGAERVLRQAWTVRPREVVLLQAMARQLEARGRLWEAIEWYQVARAEHPELGVALGRALIDAGRGKEGETVLRLPAEQQPNNPELQFYLGNALFAQKKLVEAEAAYRKAIQLQPDFAAAYANLGDVLRQQKKLVEAEAALRKADQLLPNHPVIGNDLRQTQHLLQLDPKLAACLAGKDHPAGPREAAELAGTALYREHYHAAVRFYTDAFQGDAKIANDLQQQHRYNGACCAALAAAGKGNDAKALDEPARIQLRCQARDWLAADLKAYTALLDKNKAAAAAVQQVLAHWREDTDLAGVRDPAALAKLPEAERDAWKKLWADVEALRKRCDAK